jgi:hypothetical protein
LAAYYPRKLVTIRDLQKEFASLDLFVEDEADEDRLEHIAAFVSLHDGSIQLSLSNNSVQLESTRKGGAKEEEGSCTYVFSCHVRSQLCFANSLQKREGPGRSKTWMRRTHNPTRSVPIFLYKYNELKYTLAVPAAAAASTEYALQLECALLYWKGHVPAGLLTSRLFFVCLREVIMLGIH